MSGGTNEPQHRLLFPNNSSQPTSLISHHPNTHMSNPPLQPLTHSYPTPQSSPTESADAHSTQHTTHTAYTQNQHIHRISIYTHIHIHTQNIHRIGTSTQSVRSCQTLSVSQFGRGARMCANTSIRRTETWQCVEELGIRLRNFFFQDNRKSVLVKRNKLTQSLKLCQNLYWLWDWFFFLDFLQKLTVFVSKANIVFCLCVEYESVSRKSKTKTLIFCCSILRDRKDAIILIRVFLSAKKKMNFVTICHTKWT